MRKLENSQWHGERYLDHWKLFSLSKQLLFSAPASTFPHSGHEVISEQITHLHKYNEKCIKALFWYPIVAILSHVIFTKLYLAPKKMSPIPS